MSDGSVFFRFFTVNSKIFAKVLFSRNLAYRKGYFRETIHMRSFVKMQPSRNGNITLSFTDIGKS